MIAGGECLACGSIHAPAQTFGCERCGASDDRLVARNLPPTGTVVSRAVVHVHRFPSPKTPFVVLEVALDAGPVVRALASGSDVQDYLPGTSVTGAIAGDDGLLFFVRTDDMGAA